MKKTTGLLALALFARVLAMGQTPAVTNEEALHLGRVIETEINAGLGTTMNQLMDPDKLVERVAEKSPALKDEKNRKSFTAGVASSATDFGKPIVRSARGGSYKVLRTYEKDGYRHLVFRLMDSLANLNYHDFTLIKVGGAIKASDCYIYLDDEAMSTTMSRFVNAVNLSKMDNPDTAELGFLVRMINFSQKRDYSGVISSFEASESRQKKDKAVYLMYVNACKHVDKEKYRKVLTNYTILYPDGTGGYLQMIMLYTLEANAEKGLSAVNRLDSLVGSDPMLNYYRGKFYNMSGNMTEAIRCYEIVYRYDPLFDWNALRLIVAYAATREKKKARATIEEYKKSTVFQQEPLDAIYKQYPDLK